LTGFSVDSIVDYAALDYRCDPRVEPGPADDSYVATDDDGSVWQILMWGGPWTIFDDAGHRAEYRQTDTPEEALHQVLGDPLPSAYMRDSRVEPADRNGTPVNWQDDPEAFHLWADPDHTTEIGYVWYDPDNETWFVRLDAWPANEWAPHELLDEALSDCLGDPDRPYNSD
jgi:hypothetical protein